MRAKLYTKDEMLDLISEATAELACEYAKDEASGATVMAIMLVSSDIMAKITAMLEEQEKGEE